LPLGARKDGCGANFLKLLMTSEPFDVILLDVKMPDMDSFTACRAMRKLDLRMPVVLLSACQEALCFNEAHSAGADAYLVKPTCGEALRSVLSALLDSPAASRGLETHREQEEADQVANSVNPPELGEPYAARSSAARCMA